MTDYARMSTEELHSHARRLADALGRRGGNAAGPAGEPTGPELTAAREALADARDRYAELFDFAPVPYLTLDRNGLVQAANVAAGELLDTPRDRLEGTPLFALVTREDHPRVLEHMRRCRAGEQDVVTELGLTGDDDLRVDAYTRRLPGSDGADYLTMLLDTRERRRLLAAERAEARSVHEAKDRFLAMVSHELRNPLAPILTAAEVLKARTDLPAGAPRLVEMIARNAAIEARLIDDLLDVSRILRNKLHLERAPVELHGLLAELHAPAAARAADEGVRLEVQAEAIETWVEADAVRLRQILWNLLDNAFKHTPAGGRVRLRSETPEAGRIALTVSDTGAGIAPGRLRALFEPFQQAEQGAAGGGLGLGLPIARSLAEAHGGRLTGDSAGPGRGSWFRLEMPTGAAPAAGAPAPQAPERHPQNGERVILVLEDNADIRASTSMVLETAGYRVRTAGSLAEAAPLVPAADLVISDVGLPDGDGREVLRHAPAGRRLPAIALSGFGGEEQERASREAGFGLHLTKPAPVDRLLDAVQEMLAAEGGQPPPGAEGGPGTHACEKGDGGIKI
jgi:signal transduction histidine kinase/ActR/RegA family two-component response regulator